MCFELNRGKACAPACGALALPDDVLLLLLSFLPSQDLIVRLYPVCKALQRAAAQSVKALHLTTCTCPALRTLTKRFPNVTAARISFDSSAQHANLPMLRFWSRLTYLSLYDCPVRELSAISEESCPALRALSLQSSQVDELPKHLPPRLVVLNITVTSLCSIHPLTALKHLKVLSLSVIHLNTVGLSADLAKLVYLEAIFIPATAFFDVISALPRLRKIRVGLPSSHCLELTALQSGEWPGLEVIDVWNQESLSFIPEAILSRLTAIRCHFCPYFHSLNDFQLCICPPALKHLDVSNTRVTDFAPLSRCNNLCGFCFGSGDHFDFFHYYNLDPLAGLPKLAAVIMISSSMSKVVSLTPLWSCPTLNHVVIYHSSQLLDRSQSLSSKVTVLLGDDSPDFNFSSYQKLHNALKDFPLFQDFDWEKYVPY